MKGLFLCAILAVSGCAQNAVSTSTFDESIAKDHNGQYLTLSGAIQAYLGGDNDYLEISWNIAKGYRLYTALTTMSDEAGLLACEWSGLISKENVPDFGLIATAKTLATTQCKRRSPGSPIPNLVIQYMGGETNGLLFLPGEMHLYKKNARPRFYSGLVISDISRELMSSAPALIYGGMLVISAVPGSPAERSGLLRGDIITTVNDIPVRSAEQFVYQFQSSEHEGLELQLDVYRLPGGFQHMRVRLEREIVASQSTENDAHK